MAPQMVSPSWGDAVGMPCNKLVAPIEMLGIYAIQLAHALRPESGSGPAFVHDLSLGRLDLQQVALY